MRNLANIVWLIIERSGGRLSVYNLVKEVI